MGGAVPPFSHCVYGVRRHITFRDLGLLGYGAVSLVFEWFLTFRRNLVPSSSRVKRYSCTLLYW
jgi:hypothetical protein